MCEPCIIILQPGWQQESVSYVDQGSPMACQDFKGRGQVKGGRLNHISDSLEQFKNTVKSVFANWLRCRFNLRGIYCLDLCKPCFICLCKGDDNR